MFTGIVEELGTVSAITPGQAGARLAVTCSAVLRDAAIGSSIAVNGACLTAVELTADSFAADLSPETLKRTNLGDLRPGSPVNLERPLRVDSRLDGHFVLGHVDGVAEVQSLEALGGDNWWLRVRIPGDFLPYIVGKGSLALDGISLTVAEISGEIAGFTVIPQTYEHTTLRTCRPGSRLNFEVDILAKHVARLISKD